MKDKVSEILSEEKTIEGKVSWKKQNKNKNSLHFKVPLEINGEIIGGLYLNCTANIKETSFTIIYDGQAITRMQVNPQHMHTNPSNKKINNRNLRGLRIKFGETKFHSWENNKYNGFPYPKHLSLPVAEIVEEKLDCFDDALNYFFRNANIKLNTKIPKPTIDGEFDF